MGTWDYRLPLTLFDGARIMPTTAFVYVEVRVPYGDTLKLFYKAASVNNALTMFVQSYFGCVAISVWDIICFYGLSVDWRVAFFKHLS